MADNKGSRIPGALLEGKLTKKVAILTFIIKLIDTCCELLKIVKFQPRAIQNPTEGIVDMKVDSKGEGKWSAKYQALVFKVGSLSDGTDTVSCSKTEKSITRFFSDLMNKLMTLVQYHPLDCDTMHAIDDVHVYEDGTDESEMIDKAVGTNQDVDDQKEETSDHYKESKEADEEVQTNLDNRNVKTETEDKEARNEIIEETIHRSVDRGQSQKKQATKKTEGESQNSALDVFEETIHRSVDRGQPRKKQATKKTKGESQDSKLDVFAETSKNPGYRRLKLIKRKPMTENQKQKLFLFKLDKSGYLKKPKPNIVKDLVTCYVKEHNFKPDVAIMVNEPKCKILMFSSCQGQMGNQNYSETKDTFRAVGLDWVPCLKMKQWPKEAKEWITRDRKSNWPGQELIDEVVKAGCHLVPKAHPNNQDDATEWRISFSEAERILFMHLSDTQKTCFRMFKMVTQLHCKVITDDKEEYPSSYTLKTIFLWACDEIAPTDWEQNLGDCFLGLFKKLAEALEDKTIKGYFIPEMNLIGHIHDKLIHEYLVIVNEIIEDPIKYLEETWQAIIQPKLGWTFDRTFGDLLRCADKSDEDQDIAKSRSCLNLALMIYDYLCQGAVARNSFKTKMAQQVYGCQVSSTTEMKMIENEVELEENVHVTEADNSGLHTVKELLEKCLHLSSTYTTNPAVLFGILVQANILAGDTDYMLGRLQEAMKSFEKAIEILTTKECKVPAGSMSRVHTKYAKCLEDENAMKEIDMALKLDPNNTEAQVYKVMLLYRIGQKEVAKRVIEDICRCKTANREAKGSKSFPLKKNTNIIQLSRGDLRLLDEILCSEVEALLNWSVKFPQVPYGMPSEAVLKVFVPEAVILGQLHMKEQNITKATLNKVWQSWVNLMEEAAKMGRADCQYIANSLLGFIYYTAGNYWEALKSLQGQAKIGLCSERVQAHLDLLKSLFKIKI